MLLAVPDTPNLHCDATSTATPSSRDRRALVVKVIGPGDIEIGWGDGIELSS